MRNFLLVMAILSSSILSCDKEENNDSIGQLKSSMAIDCDQLKNGLLEYNQETVKAEISKLTSDLSPNKTDNDEIGHLNNFAVLLERINSCNGMFAELRCYACIETYPAQTEISVIIDVEGEKALIRVLDILTPDDRSLEFVRVH